MTLRMKANAEMNVFYRFSGDGGDNGSMCADEENCWAVTTAYQTFMVAIFDSESLKSFGLCIKNTQASCIRFQIRLRILFLCPSAKIENRFRTY